MLGCQAIALLKQIVPQLSVQYFSIRQFYLLLWRARPGSPTSSFQYLPCMALLNKRKCNPLSGMLWEGEFDIRWQHLFLLILISLYTLFSHIKKIVQPCGYVWLLGLGLQSSSNFLMLILQRQFGNLPTWFWGGNMWLNWHGSIHKYPTVSVDVPHSLESLGLMRMPFIGNI